MRGTRLPSVRRVLAVAAVSATAVGGALLAGPGAGAVVAGAEPDAASWAAPGPDAASWAGAPHDRGADPGAASWAGTDPHAASWAGPIHKLSNSTSSNWAGYAATGGRYTSVSASWTQPAVNCSVTPSGWSSFWVGLDGDTSGTVEQTGTEADCSSGKAVYSAWYEMYPKFPTNYSNPVAPGDKFTASVTTDGSGSFVLTLTNSTKGWTQRTTARLKSAALASAEVIAEAPSSSGGVLPLADFGSVGFSGATANGTSFGSLSGLDRIDMVSGGVTKASTGTISGGSFTVTWKHS